MANTTRNKDVAVRAQCHLSNAHSHSMQMACLIGTAQIRRPVPLRRMRAVVNQKHIIHVPETRKRKTMHPIICSLVPAWCSGISFWKTSLCANQISLYEFRFCFLPYQKVAKSFKKTGIWKLFFDVFFLSLSVSVTSIDWWLLFFANCICSSRKKNSKQVFSILSLFFLLIIEGKLVASQCDLSSRHLSTRRILSSFSTPSRMRWNLCSLYPRFFLSSSNRVNLCSSSSFFSFYSTWADRSRRTSEAKRTQMHLICRTILPRFLDLAQRERTRHCCFCFILQQMPFFWHRQTTSREMVDQ